MTDHRPEFMFKKFFEHSGDHAADTPELQTAERFWNQLGHFTPPDDVETPTRPMWYKMPALGMAAMLVLLLGFGAWWSAPRPAEPWATFRTSHAQNASFALVDGSRLTLAAESRVNVRFDGNRRELQLLQGQALFEVAHDVERPFVVHLRDGYVRAVGTAFNIRVSSRNTEVTVTKGIVDVGVGAHKEAANPTPLRAIRGEQVQFGFRKQDGRTVAYSNKQDGVDLGDVLGWTRGKLFFNGQSLSEAAMIANTYSDKKLVIKDARLESMPIYGILDQGDVRGLIVAADSPNGLEIVDQPSPAARVHDGT